MSVGRAGRAEEGHEGDPPGHSGSGFLAIGGYGNGTALRLPGSLQRVWILGFL